METEDKRQITLPKLLRDKQLKEHAGKKVLLEFCRSQSNRRVSLEQARRILARVPFSLAERVIALREEKAVRRRK